MHNHQKNKFDLKFFDNQRLYDYQQIKPSAEILYQILSNPNFCLVAYKDYCEQMPLATYFDKNNPDAEKLLISYMEHFDINVSNNYGMTLLHNLIWYNRLDLARLVVYNPHFNKINYRFCIPYGAGLSGSGSIYASALDLAIGRWLEKSVELEFIELLLKYGAKLPKLGSKNDLDMTKKFLDSELLAYFFPAIVDASLNNNCKGRLCQEIVDLFRLLNSYGFSIDDLEKKFNDRLFHKSNPLEGRCKEFEEKYSVSVEKQHEILDTFFARLKIAVMNNPEGKRLVEMTDARMADGQATLELPFNPSNPPCNAF